MGHRFVAEVQAVTSAHPNIVGIHDFGVISERAAGLTRRAASASPWFAMEFCADEDLISGGRPTGEGCTMCSRRF